MIVVKLMGGLGNQMFQYACGKHLADKHGTTLKFDTAFLLDRSPNKNPNFVFRDYDLDIFGIDVPTASASEVNKLRDRFRSRLLNKIANRLIGRKRTYLVEDHFHFMQAALCAPDNCYLEGYWQSPRYFPGIPLSNLFPFQHPVSGKGAELLDRISSVNSVCINIRRADFVNSDFHGTIGPEWYGKAEALLMEMHADLQLFIFSDDIEWCAENLRFQNPATLVGHEYAGRKFSDYLQLMIACKHFIIPNSSFAWWAATLAENPDKTVIAPEKWFLDNSIDTSDLIPASWKIL